MSILTSFFNKYDCQILSFFDNSDKSLCHQLTLKIKFLSCNIFSCLCNKKENICPCKWFTNNSGLLYQVDKNTAKVLQIMSDQGNHGVWVTAIRSIKDIKSSIVSIPSYHCTNACKTSKIWSRCSLLASSGTTPPKIRWISTCVKETICSHKNVVPLYDTSARDVSSQLVSMASTFIPISQ